MMFMNANQDNSAEGNAISEEVTVEFAAQYLGTTQRTVTNYLKSKQLSGQKVGKVWFISRDSLLSMRPANKLRRQSQLPAIENNLNKNQYKKLKRREKYKKEWALVKTPKRNLKSLRPFARINECLGLLEQVRDDLNEQEYKFNQEELLQIADDLGAGYFQYGKMKLTLYNRARLKSGRLVARGVLAELPPGLTLEFYQLAESVGFLCRSIEKRRLTVEDRPKERGR